MRYSQTTSTILTAFLVMAKLLPGQTGPKPLYSADAQSRAGALLAQMTLEEKIGQLNQPFVFQKSPQVGELAAAGKVGSYLFVTDPAYMNQLQHLAVEKTRLHIPLLFGFDVIHGFRTIFPVPIAMAASWDPAGAVTEQTIAAAEASATGIRFAFAPMVDIARDPRWGRMVEGAGEDPFLGAAIARAQVLGFQGPSLGTPGHMLACVKHFAGYGAAEGGRDYDSSYLPEALMQNVYLPPFHAAVDAGVGSVMSAYMDLNDVPGAGNRWLLHDVLRIDWGFQGFVVGDAFAVGDLVTHGFAADPKDAAARAISAGLDMEMGSDAMIKNLAALVQENRISTAQIDDAVRPILATKYQLGLFDHPYIDEAKVEHVVTAPEHRDAARIAAERSAVLLKNDSALLPLNPAAHKNIAVIGALANSKIDVIGPWSLAAHANDAITILDGIRSKVPGVQVRYAPGVQLIRTFPSMFDAIVRAAPVKPWSEAESETEIQKAADLAKSSDLSILVLGETWNMSGENASVSSLQLPNKQEQLLERVAATGKPVVLLLMSGRPLDIRWATAHVPAIVEVWFPGIEGGPAVANLLFGAATPGGKLPVSWPRTVGQVPINYAHNLTHSPKNQGKRYSDEESTPLFPFGYGLSYTKFAFSNLQVNTPGAKAGQDVDVSVGVENTGDRAGDEVAQLYIHQRTGSASRPVRELKGFERISLALKKAVQEPAPFDVWAGADSTAELHATFTVAP